MASGEGRVIGIISSKGGVGKTTITANVGVALASLFNKKVLAMDANITTPSLGFHLGIMSPAVTVKDVYDDSAHEAVYAHESGLDVIPGAHSIPRGFVEGESNSERMRKGNAQLSQYDFLLLDSAPGLTKESKIAIKTADELLIVANPDFPSIANVYKQITLSKAMQRPIIGIVLNKVRGKRYEMSAESVSRMLGLPVIAQIPEDAKVREAIAAKSPVVSYAPHSKSAVAMKKLAASLAGEEYNSTFSEKLRGLLG